MSPYYQDASVTIYHGDCREVLPTLGRDGVVCITDPPYGINYTSGYTGCLDRSIAGDETTELRDWLLTAWLPRSCAIFASWRCLAPSQPKGQLVWEKATRGMGDLSFPWGMNYEVIWIYGDEWTGHRDGAVLRGRTIPTWNSGPARRLHPHEKPVDVVGQLIAKANAATVFDPFMGSGSTMRAAKDLGRRAIGIEIDERYCEVAARRCSQETLDLGAA